MPSLLGRWPYDTATNDNMYIARPFHSIASTLVESLQSLENLFVVNLIALAFSRSTIQASPLYKEKLCDLHKCFFSPLYLVPAIYTMTGRLWLEEDYKYPDI